MKSRRQTKIWIVALVVAGIFCASQSALSLPSDYEVKNGTADIQVNGNEMTISASENAIIDFGTFNIAENESVFVTLPTANSQILNRVTGGTQSDIFGDLTCNGLFILVNEAGIHIGENADINVGSIILSTRDIANSNFVDGNYLFERLSAEALDRLLLNEGTITVTDGGFGVMIAGAVENRGVVTARLGKVALVGGDAVTVNLAGPRSLISIAIQEGTASEILDYEGNSVLDQITNTGTLSADGGTVVLDAESVNHIFRNAINLEGYVNAIRAEEVDGVIRIVADGDVVINAEVEATQIEIGDADTKVPENVTISGGYLEAEETITVLANSDITVNTNMSTTDGDINLYADYDGDATGSFSQIGGVISAGGAGDVYIDGSLVMEVGEIQTGTGEIMIGTLVAPEMIIGDAYFVHNSGNFDIDAVTSEDGITILETVRGDVLRYATEGNVTLETPRGDINTAPGVVIPGNQVKLSGQRIGAYDNPVGINANITYINRMQGDIDITSMWGLGSTLYIRGPAPSDPDAWGAISYNLGSDLVLEAENVNIISESVESVDIDYDTLTVASNAEAFYFYGNVTFYNFHANVPWTQLYFEPGKTYTFRGDTSVGVLDDTHASVFMRSHEQGESWYISNESDNYVFKKVIVQDGINLDGDTDIYGSPSSNWGENMGWDFNTVIWDGSGDWDVPGNWTGGSVPQSGDDVLFNGTSTSNSDMDRDFTIKSLTLAEGYTGTVDLQWYTLDCNGGIRVEEGTLNAASALLYVGGDWFVASGGGANVNPSLWFTIFDSGGPATITPGDEVIDFYDIIFDNADGVWSIDDDIGIEWSAEIRNGRVVQTAGSFDMIGGETLTVKAGCYLTINDGAFLNGDRINVYGTLTSEGTASLGDIGVLQIVTGGELNLNADGTLISVDDYWYSPAGATIDAVGDWTLRIETADAFLWGIGLDNLIVALGDSEEKVTVTGHTSFSGDVTVNTGILTLSSSLDIGGNFYIDPDNGSLSVSNRAVSFSSAEAVSINIPAPAPWKDFYDIDFSGTGSWDVTISGGDFYTENDFLISGGGTVSLAAGTAAMRCDGDFEISKGTLTTNSKDITVGGSWTVNSDNGVFDDGSTEVTFTDWTQITCGGASNAFYDLVCDGVGVATLSLADTLYVDNDFTVSNGKVYTYSNDFYVGGSWDFTGTLYAQNSNNAVIFNGAGENTIATGGEEFRNLTFDGTGRWTLLEDMIVAEDLLLTDGTLNADEYSIKAGGWTNNAGADAFEPGTGTVIFTWNGSDELFTGGTVLNAVDFQSSCSLLDDLTVSGDFIITSGVIHANAHNIIVGGSWIDSGRFYGDTGTVTLEGNVARDIENGSSSEFNDLIINSSASTGTWTLQDELNVAGDFTITDGFFNTGANEVNVEGDWINGGTVNRGAADIDINGSWTNTGTVNAGAGDMDIAVDWINSGIFNAGDGNMWMGGSWTNSGTFSMGSGTAYFRGNGGDITSGGASFSSMYMHSSGARVLRDNLSVDGDLMIYAGTITQGANDITIGGNLNSRIGVWDAGVYPTFRGGSGTTNIAGNLYLNMNGVFNAGTGTIIVGNDLTSNDTRAWTTTTLNCESTSFYIGNNVSFPSKADAEAGANAIVDAGSSIWEIGGNFSNYITDPDNWDAGTASFEFVNAAKTSTISGDTTFYDFICTAAGKTLEFEAGSTQTITSPNTLTLTGADGSPINLISTVDGTQWNINPAGADVSYVEYKDSVNLGASAIDPLNSVDLGNNINWISPPVQEVTTEPIEIPFKTPVGPEETPVVSTTTNPSIGGIDGEGSAPVNIGEGNGGGDDSGGDPEGPDTVDGSEPNQGNRKTSTTVIVIEGVVAVNSNGEEITLNAGESWTNSESEAPNAGHTKTATTVIVIEGVVEVSSDGEMITINPGETWTDFNETHKEAIMKLAAKNDKYTKSVEQLESAKAKTGTQNVSEEDIKTLESEVEKNRKSLKRAKRTLEKAKCSGCSLYKCSKENHANDV